MRKFIIRALCFFSIFIALFVIVAGSFSWSYKYNHNFLEGYAQKEELLSEVQSPRIIFQGGSNVTYGINSEAVEDSIHIHTLNAALHVGLGMRLMLYMVFDYCREGDILVLSPEFEHFYGWAYGNSETKAVLAMLYPKVAKHYNVRQIIDATKGIPDALQIMRSELLISIEDIFLRSYDSDRFKSRFFNSHGDLVYDRSNSSDTDEIQIVPFREKFDEEYFDEFCETIDTLRNRGVNVLIIPPSVYDKTFEVEKDNMHFIADRLQMAGHPFEYDLELSVYERADMYETQHHLNKAGSEKRMKLIVDMLRNKLSI